jgi:hypothetical protein
VAVLAINSDDIQFTTAVLPDIAGKDMRQLGFQMARDLSVEHKNPGRQILTVFPTED